MERRKFIAAMGSLAAGGAAATGTGAFTSVDANRGLEVQTAGDASALLKLDDIDGSGNEEYVATSGNTISIDISTENGDGLNRNATTKILNLFRIRNQGTQDVVVYTTGGPDGVRFSATGGDFANDDSNYNGFAQNQGALSVTSNLDEDDLAGDMNGGAEGAPVLAPGDYIDVELFSYGGKDVQFDGTVNVNAVDADGV